MKRHRLLLRCAVLSLVFASAAQSISSPAGATEDVAPPPADVAPPRLHGWQFGAAVGYAVPVGYVSSVNTGGLSTKLSDLETGTVPLAIDWGYRFSRRTYLGGTIVWGPGIAPNSGGCPQNASCYRQNMQARVEGRLYLNPRERVGSWLAAGMGWEVATYSQAQNGSSVTRTFTGPVLANLEIGVDARHDSPAIVPYAGVTFATFLTQGLNPAASPVSTRIPSPSLHAWVGLGLRGTWGLF